MGKSENIRQVMILSGSEKSEYLGIKEVKWVEVKFYFGERLLKALYLIINKTNTLL
jgi:hypothetical protein